MIARPEQALDVNVRMLKPLHFELLQNSQI